MTGKKPDEFSISVFARFSYILSALIGHCFVGFGLFRVLGNVRSVQTGCARTGGHLISEKPPPLLPASPGVGCGCGRIFFFLFFRWELWYSGGGSLIESGRKGWGFGYGFEGDGS